MTDCDGSVTILQRIFSFLLCNWQPSSFFTTLPLRYPVHLLRPPKPTTLGTPSPPQFGHRRLQFPAADCTSNIIPVRELKTGCILASILHLGFGYLPHPDKVETGGEDAHFICEEKGVIGVADGVGGWADVGVDAGEYT